MAVVCSHCQFSVPKGAAHCPNCGQPLPQQLLQPGEIVCDDYRVVSLLGHGGMGEVYLALHLLTEHQVAVKILAPQLAEEPDLRIRFLEEARILAKLDHPNVTMLHNFRQERGRMHLVMQYVSGPSLDRILSEQGTISAERAALLFAPLCDALGHAHDLGIIHRDLKPSNILVDQSGKPKLTDFGIAKLTVGGAELTAANARVGTSWFMSPEQGMHRPADARSDIYSLGISLYNALAGYLPFSGESEYEIIKGHIELPPPAIFAPEGPRAPAGPLEHAVEQVCMRALQKDPAQRFPTAYGFRDALLAALSSHSQAVQLQPAGEVRAVFTSPPVPTGSVAPAAGSGASATETPVRSGSVGRPVAAASPPRTTPERGVGPAPPARRKVTSERAPVSPLAAPDDGGADNGGRGPSLHTPPGRAAAPGMTSPTPGIIKPEDED